MKSLNSFDLCPALALAAILAVATFVGGARAQAPATPVSAPATPAKVPDLASLQAELERLKTLLPDQAHAMSDVDYHFSNLWFAADKQNWPLAQFYVGETKFHLNWAVRIRPLRKTAAGQDIDLKAILQTLEAGPLAELKKSVDAKDGPLFRKAYGQMIEGCYACHVASEKPYLRTRIPESPATRIIRLAPEVASQP